MDELNLLTADEVIAELRIYGALRFKRGDVESALQPRTTAPGRGPVTHGQIRGTGGFRGMKRG